MRIHLVNPSDVSFGVIGIGIHTGTQVWERSSFLKSLRARMAFVLISKLYRQMYANTGIATDSARVRRSALWARWLARFAHRLFASDPMPALREPRRLPAASGKRIPVVSVS